jgi:RNA polymerase sigma-70 factor, ECF subfamily
VDASATETALLRALLPRTEEGGERLRICPEAVQRLHAVATSSAGSTDPIRFIEHVALCLDTAEDLDAQLLSLHLEDLHVALMCALGHPQAIARFVADHGDDIDLALRKAESTGVSRAERRQIALTRLLSADAKGPPRISGYAGRGALRAWVRMAGSRLAVDLLRQHHRQPHASADPEIVARAQDQHADPQLALMQHMYRNEVHDAFERAFGELTPRERRLLRHHLLERSTFEQLGALFGVHRTTAARWLEQAQDRLLLLARDHVRARVGAQESTAGGIIALVRSQLEVSVQRLLASTDARD